MVKNTGAVEFEACTSADVENNSLFLDISDNILKKKDNSGTVKKLSGIESGVFWLDSELYDVYDDFSSYSTGTLSTNTNWTIIDADTYGTATIVTSANAGGDGTQELDLSAIAHDYGGGNYQTETVEIRTNLLGVDKHKYFFMKCFAAEYSSAWDGGTIQIKIGSSGTYYTLLTVSSGGANGSYGNVTTLSSIIVIAKGSNTYDLFFNGNLIASSITEVNPQIYIKVSEKNFGSTVYARCYIGEVRESQDTV